MDYVQSMKEAMGAGESLAAVLEGVGQLVSGELTAARGEDAAALRKILKLCQEAQHAARKAGL